MAIILEIEFLEHKIFLHCDSIDEKKMDGEIDDVSKSIKFLMYHSTTQN